MGSDQKRIVQQHSSPDSEKDSDWREIGGGKPYPVLSPEGASSLLICDGESDGREWDPGEAALEHPLQSSSVLVGSEVLGMHQGVIDSLQQGCSDESDWRARERHPGEATLEHSSIMCHKLSYDGFITRQDNYLSASLVISLPFCLLHVAYMYIHC